MRCGLLREKPVVKYRFMLAEKANFEIVGPIRDVPPTRPFLPESKSA
jgi:hypothetical protein